MRRAFAGDRLGARVAERIPIETGEKILAFAEQHRAHSEMQFIDEACL